MADPRIEVERLADARVFLAQAGPFLERHEAEHNLLFGIADTVMRDPERWSHAGLLFLVVRRDRGVVGAALMTPPYNIVLSSMDEATWMALADDLDRRRVAIPGVTGPAELARAFAERWATGHGLAAERTMAERIYRLEHVTGPTGVPGTIRLATDADRETLLRWSDAFMSEAHGRHDPTEANDIVDSALRSGVRTFHLWEHEGRPVSMAGVTGPTPNGIRIGPVYTPPEDRGHGFASAVTAAASQACLDAGRRFVFLFTDLQNPTSNRIYQRIGFEPVSDVDQWVFAPEPGKG